MTDIQWFPLHMHHARNAIKKLLRDTDVVVELLDARAPLSSCNPLIQGLIKHKKTIRLLNKSDLADPLITQMWLEYFAKQSNTKAIATRYDDKKQKARLINLCRSMAPNRNSFEKPLRVMITGIPNVGKSTLINLLTKAKSAKAGDVPALTRVNQCLTLADDFLIYDTPGITWEKIDHAEIGYNLALCNSIGRNALDEEILALYLIKYMLYNYPEHLSNRYKLPADSVIKSITPNATSQRVENIFRIIGSKRGCLLQGGILDRQKIAELIIQDFRNGKLGQISLETPNNVEFNSQIC